MAFAAAWHVLTHELLVFAACALALSSLDDLLVDTVFFGLLARRGSFGRDLPAATTAPGWMAIIIPAWDEADVIGAMLARLLARIDYPVSRVFVGVYPNDAATRACVAAIDDPRLAMVTCTQPGPTTKADCLNHLWRAVVAHERTAAIRFKGVVLHDAEDVVDGRELAVFNAHLERLAMVQLPVVPLVDRTSRWISGHYLDEFAEAHGKDILVRGAVGAGVPSAGVACAIDREVLGILAGPGNAPFDPASMTEDYEIGLRIAALGRAGALVRCGEPGDIVVAREHFPATLDAAIRQKTRWLLGIALDGWDRIDWPRGFVGRYMLVRDRKSVVAPLLVAAGYVATAMVAVDALVAWFVPAAHAFAPLVRAGSPLAVLLVVNAGVLGWRLGVRVAFTASVHGWREGLRAVPRTVVANLINARAAARALRRYRRIRSGREAPRWDKTAHRFPAA